MRVPGGSFPELIIRLDLLRHNAGALTRALKKKSIDTWGVTKACFGDAHVASAMLDGGVSLLADSRSESLRRLRAAYPMARLAMLRPAVGVELAGAWRDADLFLASSEEALADLAGLARAGGRAAPVVLMLETGGGREGIFQEHARDAMRRVAENGFIQLVGLGTHTCCRGTAPSPASIEWLLELAGKEKGCFKVDEPIISAGNSAMLLPALGGELPGGINLRIGEALLLGRETTHGEKLEGLRDDVFTLSAEVVESRDQRGGDGRTERRILVAMGRSDLGAGSAFPREESLRVLEYFGDLTLLAGEGPSGGPRRGEAVAFSLDYLGVLGAMAGPFVSREYRDDGLV